MFGSPSTWVKIDSRGVELMLTYLVAF